MGPCSAGGLHTHCPGGGAHRTCRGVSVDSSNRLARQVSTCTETVRTSAPGYGVLGQQNTDQSRATPCLTSSWPLPTLCCHSVLLFSFHPLDCAIKGSRSSWRRRSATSPAQCWPFAPSAPAARATDQGWGPSSAGVVRPKIHMRTVECWEQVGTAPVPFHLLPHMWHRACAFYGRGHQHVHRIFGLAVICRR